MNNNEPPQKTPPKLAKNKHFWHFWNNPKHTKNKPFNIKTLQKTNPKKNHFAMFKNNPLFSINFLFFFTYSFCFWKPVFSWKHYKNSVFRKTQLFKNTVSKTHFFNHVKKHLFQKKRCHFCFLTISAETPIFVVFSALHCFGPKKILAKTDSVHENARFFLPSWHK